MRVKVKKNELDAMDDKIIDLVSNTHNPARLAFLASPFHNNDSILSALLKKDEGVLAEMLSQNAVTRKVRNFIIQNIEDVEIVKKIADGKYVPESAARKNAELNVDELDLDRLSILKNPNIEQSSELLVAVFKEIKSSQLRKEILDSLPNEGVRDTLNKTIAQSVSAASNRNSIVNQALHQDPTAGVTNNDAAPNLGLKS